MLDSASDALARIRSELRVAQERLLSTLERIVHSTEIKPYLQEALVTQRQGRYVIPVRAEYKGNVDGIVHDQSASGATLFIEPLKVVQQNNAVRELELQEEHEVRRILAELTDMVAEEAHYLRRNTQVLAELDFTFAKAKYGYALDATLPDMMDFQPPKPKAKQNGSDAERLQHPGSVIDLRRARHPLLDPRTVVPIDVYLDDNYYIIVVTGPNTGGKTVTLKTVGLLVLMAQSGMLIPADVGSKLSIFEGVYADIGDEQSIEQNLSTFSSHLTNIISILEETDPHTLVLLDELGAGTDPEEGSALAMALLENLRDRGITTLATTHYSDLKLFAHNTPGVVNASMEFDVETLSPTYELSIGLPGKSNALTIARRLGLNPVIVERAEAMVRPDTLRPTRCWKRSAAPSRRRRPPSNASRRGNGRRISWKPTCATSWPGVEQARRAVIAETRDADAERAGRGAPGDRAVAAPGACRLHRRAAPAAHDEFLVRAEKELARRQQQAEPVNRDVVVPGAGGATLVGPIEVGDRVWVANLQASGEVLAVHERHERGRRAVGQLPAEAAAEASGTAAEGRQGRAGAARHRAGGRAEPPAPAWSSTCAASASKRGSTASNAISTTPTWRGCRGCASFTATARAPCAPPCATP